MAEVIKTVLTADSSELAAEFAKASAIAQKYAADRESQGNRALASARAEVEALRLEATGHGAAAAALREKMQLTEQARQLAAKAGLTEENATRILARQLELKKQMVTASAAAAAAEQRAARISAPGRSGIALPEMALTAKILQDTEKATARTNEFRRSLQSLGPAGQGSAMGLFAVSQAIEDAQYGFKGVINNVPQAVMAFGGFTPAAMRLAAGLSMVAVAGYAAWQAGYRLGADQSVLKWAEAQTAALATAKEALDRYQDATRQRRDREASADRIAEQRERENAIIARGLKLDEYRLAALEKQAAALDRKRAAEDAILAAARQSGGFAPKRVTNAGRKLEDTRSTEDAAAAQARLNELGQEWQRIWQEIPARAGEYAAAARAAGQEMETATDSLDMLKSKAAEIAILLKDKDAYGDKDRARFTADLEAIRAQIAAREKLITQKQAEKELNAQLAKEATTEGRASLERINKMREAERLKLEQLKESAKLQGKLRQIEDATKVKEAKEKQAPFDAAQKTAREELEVLRARAAGENNRAGQLRAAATLEREILEIMREQNLSREEATKQAKERTDLERNKARGDILTEIKALKMEASGDKKGADRLREEMRIREEAVTLAERLGITESQAQNLLREKARLEKEIADRKKNGGDDEHHRVRGRIYKKTADEPRLTRDNLGRDGFTGLRRHEIHRRTTKRANRPTKPADDSAKNLLKSVNIQEEMLKIWQKLNVV